MKTLMKIIAMVALTALMLTLTKCEGRKTENHEVEVTTDENRNDVEVNADYSRERNELRNDLTELRNDIDRELEKIERNIKTANGKNKSKLESARVNLNNERSEVNTELEKLDNSTEKNWAEIKLSARNTANDVREAFRKLGNEIADVLDGEDDGQ